MPQAEQLADDLAASNAATSAEENSKISVPKTMLKKDIATSIEIDQTSLAADGIKSGADLYIKSYSVKTSKGKAYDGLTVDKSETGEGYLKSLSLDFADMGIYTLTLDLVNTAGASVSYTYKVYKTVATPAGFQISLNEENYGVFYLSDLFRDGYVGAKALTFSTKSIKVYDSNGKESVADVGVRDMNKDKFDDLYIKTGGDVVRGTFNVINSDKTETTVNFTVKAVAKMAERVEAKAMEARALEPAKEAEVLKK